MPEKQKTNIIKDKTFDFALMIIKLCKHLKNTKNEYVMTKQLLRSGTSIGANVEEAISAQSRKDFISKMSIALKETRETNYWLRLLKESGYIQKERIIEKSIEIRKILSSIVKTTSQNS